MSYKSLLQRIVTGYHLSYHHSDMQFSLHPQTASIQKRFNIPQDINITSIDTAIYVYKLQFLSGCNLVSPTRQFARRGIPAQAQRAADL